MLGMGKVPLSLSLPLIIAGGDRPYLISGADDKLVKIWDYQTKACVQVRE